MKKKMNFNNLLKNLEAVSKIIKQLLFFMNIPIEAQNNFLLHNQLFV